MPSTQEFICTLRFFEGRLLDGQIYDTGKLHSVMLIGTKTK